MSPSQRATCRILSGHKESTSPFEVAEGVGQIKVAVEKVAEKGGCKMSEAEKGGCSRDRWEGKSRGLRSFSGSLEGGQRMTT